MSEFSSELISVVIPNYNGSDYLRACLDSVLAGSLVPKIIVVDNGSSDCSCEMVEKEYPQVLLLRLKANTGFCHAVNAGLHLVRTPYAMLLNNDTSVDRDCLQKLLCAMEKRPSCFAVQALMLSMKEPDRIDDDGDLYNALGWAFARHKNAEKGKAAAAPLFAAIGTRVTSKGPIIYKQTRIGLHSKPFTMYKFRTMRVQSAEEEKKGWTIPGDDRVTKFGSFLRRTSIDEMPQFFNVLAGKMSLVGPRPERPQFVDKFREEIPRYMVKHQVRPGITGWAQINGYRGDTSIRKRIEHDIYYIENWSLGFDFRILFLTVFKGFINKNAY